MKKHSSIIVPAAVALLLLGAFSVSAQVASTTATTTDNTTATTTPVATSTQPSQETTAGTAGQSTSTSAVASTTNTTSSSTPTTTPVQNTVSTSTATTTSGQAITTVAPIIMPVVVVPTSGNSLGSDFGQFYYDFPKSPFTTRASGVALADPAPVAGQQGSDTSAPVVQLWTTNGTSGTELSWKTSFANSCTASGAWNGSKALSGSQQVGMGTFVLTCENAQGTTRVERRVSAANNSAAPTTETIQTQQGAITPVPSTQTQTVPMIPMSTTVPLNQVSGALVAPLSPSSTATTTASSSTTLP